VDHEFEVRDGGGMNKDQFVALVRFKVYQKRLHISANTSAGLIVRGLCSRCLGSLPMLTESRTTIIVGRLQWLRIYYDRPKTQ